MLGMMIPPSLLMIVYAVLAEQSVGRMFLAGVGPGLLLALAFTVTILILEFWDWKAAIWPNTAGKLFWGKRASIKYIRNAITISIHQNRTAIAINGGIRRRHWAFVEFVEYTVAITIGRALAF